MQPLSDLEREVIEMLLAGKHPALPTLRKQLLHSSVASRKLQYASSTELYVDPGIEDAPLKGKFNLGGVIAESISGLKWGVGFSLHISGGRLHSLDGVTFDEPWPESWPQVRSYRLFYVPEPTLLDQFAD